MSLIPETGSIGNVTLIKKFYLTFPAGSPVPGPELFQLAKSELLAAGLIKLGRGKGGSVKRAVLTVQDIREMVKVLTPIQNLPLGTVIAEGPGGVLVIGEENSPLSEQPSIPDSTGVSIDENSATGANGFVEDGPSTDTF